MVGAISKRTHWHLASFRTFGQLISLSDAQLIFDRRHTCALHDVTGCKQWTMEEWWEQAHARACHNTTCNCSCKLQYACKVSYLFEHRGEGTDQEFGNVVPISHRHRIRAGCGGLAKLLAPRNENAFL